MRWHRPWPACCGASCSRRRSASSPTCCSRLGIDWNWVLNGGQAMPLVVIAVDLEADLLQLPVLPGRTAVDSALADRGRGHRRRAAVAALLDHRVSAAVADHVLPAGRQHRLRLLRHLRRDRRHHRRAARRAPPQILVYKVYRRRREVGRPGRLVGAIGDPDGDRHRAHGGAVPLRRTAGSTTDGSAPTSLAPPADASGFERPGATDMVERRPC